MKTEITQLREKSKRSLEVAHHLHRDNNHDFAVSRAYYALFYTAEAMLLMKGKSFSKHSAVISAIYQFYVAEGLLDKKYHQILDRAFDLRNDADYLIPNVITQESSQQLLAQAEEFLQATEKFFI